MLRVFDGKIETEEEDSETEHIFEMGGNLSGKGAGKVGCFVSLLYMFAILVASKSQCTSTCT